MTRKQPFPQGARLLIGAAALLLLASCGSFQISLEEVADGAPPTPTAMEREAEPELEPTEALSSGRDGEAPFYISEPFSVGTEDARTILAVQNGVASFTESPVAMEILWDYSGPSGKIAYASEFYHASSVFNRSVTDLWVFKYATGKDEQWLVDDVGRAHWSPYQPESSKPQQLAAAVFNSLSGTFDLVLVDGPGQTRKLAECSSEEFSFSPDGSQIAYKSGWYNESEPRPDECSGVFIVALDDGSIRRLTHTDPLATGGWYRDQPLWAGSLDALLFKSFNEDSLFNIVPLGGSEWSRVGIAESIEEDYLPAPLLALWSDAHRSVIGQTEGMLDPHAVWVYRLAADGTQVEEAFRIDWGGFQHDLLLLGWWEPGESVLIRDISNPSDINPLGEVVVWSIAERSVVDTISIKPDFAMTLYPNDVTTGIPDLDDILKAFLEGDASQRAAFAETITEGCTTKQFSIGPPPCENGMQAGTIVERFPYRRYREQRYVKLEEITELMDFTVRGLYAIAAYTQRSDVGEVEVGEYQLALVSDAEQKLINVMVDQGRVVEIDFWELTPPEVFSNFGGQYVLPPL